MKIWLIQANEPIPIIDKNQRLFRIGMMAEELNANNHDITWFATTFDHYTKKQRFNENTTIVVNNHYRISLIWSPSYKKNISLKRIINHKYMAVQFRKVIEKLETPDLIYVSFPTIEFAEEAIRYGNKNNVKVIVDVRDLWPDIFKQNLSTVMGALAYPYIKLMDNKTKRVMKNAFAINSVSEEALTWSLKKADRVKQEYDRSYYIGYSKASYDQYLPEEKIRIDNEKFIISFFGTINNQFNFKLLTDVARELEASNVQFIICGNGPQMNYLQEISNSVTNIKLLGWLDSKDINYILDNSSVGFAPYKNTFDFQMGVSNKFGEYLSHSIPVIVTCEGVMENLINQYSCGFMSLDSRSIVEYILQLKNNKQIYEKSCKQANKLFCERLDAKKIYKDLANYIESIGGK